MRSRSPALPEAPEPLSEAPAIVSADPGAGRVTLDVSGVPLPEVLRLLADQADLVLAGIDLPQTPVTLRVHDIDADSALRLIFSGTSYDGFVVGRHLMVCAADQPVSRGFALQRASAAEMAPILVQAFGGSTIAADARTNSLIVQGVPSQIRMIGDMIAGMDISVPQILIRADIMEVNLGDDQEIGINWEYRLNQTRDGVNHDVDATGNPLTSVTDFALSYARLGTNEFRAFLGTLQEVVESKILSSPRVVTASGRTAEILVGERVPYPRATTETQTGGTLQEIEFVEVGVRLEVTPRIAKDGLITMTVHPEVSEVLDTAVQGVPRIGTREASTEVMVRDGETLVIGGLKRHVRTETVRRLPILGSLPIIGALFRSTRTEQSEVELLVFLTPVLVDESLAETSRRQVDVRLGELGVETKGW